MRDRDQGGRRCPFLAAAARRPRNTCSSFVVFWGEGRGALSGPWEDSHAEHLSSHCWPSFTVSSPCSCPLLPSWQAEWTHSRSQCSTRSAALMDRHLACRAARRGKGLGISAGGACTVPATSTAHSNKPLAEDGLTSYA